MNMHGPLKINCAAFHRYAKLVTRHWRHPPKTMLGFWRLVLTPSSMAQILRQDSSRQSTAQEGVSWRGNHPYEGSLLGFRISDLRIIVVGRLVESLSDRKYLFPQESHFAAGCSESPKEGPKGTANTCYTQL